MNRTCKTCGVPLAERVRRGRPREWCSPECYRVERARRRGTPSISIRSCRGCGTEIEGRRGNARYCSKRCYYVSRGQMRSEPPAARTCEVCSTRFQPKSDDRAKYCSAPCRDQRRRSRPNRVRRYTDADRVRDQRKAALRRGAATGRPVVLCEIGNRDGWQCALCSEPVNRWLEYPDPLSPSIDHILPVSLGGIHDPSNVRVTHLRCNVKRGNKLDEAEAAEVT